MTQVVSKSVVDTAQTAGITAPKNYVGVGNLSYAVSLSNINIGANMVSVSAQFSTDLDYVGSTAAIPGWSVFSASYDAATGVYSAVLQLLEQGNLSKFADAAPILNILFTGSASRDLVGALTNVSVWEVASPTSSLNIVCKLAPEAAVSLYAPYDINGDGEITLEDISLIIFNFYGAIEGDSNWAAASIYDVNGDGVVDIFDLMIIMTFI